jgi:hypothetical protein
MKRGCGDRWQGGRGRKQQKQQKQPQQRGREHGKPKKDKDDLGTDLEVILFAWFVSSNVGIGLQGGNLFGPDFFAGGEAPEFSIFLQEQRSKGAKQSKGGSGSGLGLCRNAEMDRFPAL